MRVHTQLNYKRKLQVDQAVVVKTGSTNSAHTIVTYVHRNKQVLKRGISLRPCALTPAVAIPIKLA